MGGFRFDRRNNLPISHRSHILAMYFYLSRAELFGDDLVLSRHHFDIFERLEKEGWGPWGMMGVERFETNFNDLGKFERLNKKNVNQNR
jgi:hypothetical protein